MGKIYVWMLAVALLSGRTIWAQGLGGSPRGARAAALGGAAVTLSDVWATGNNPAGLGQLAAPTAAAYAENRYLLAGLNTVGVGLAAPLGRQPAELAADAAPRLGVVGLEAQRFGNKLYSEQRLGAAYGYRRGMVSVGARLEVLQLSIEGLGSRRAVAASLGGQAELLPRRLAFGAALYNLNQAHLADDQDERVPTVLRAGLSYRPATAVLLVVEVEKDVEQAADFLAGLEYHVLRDALALRAGLRTRRQELTGGFGWHTRTLHLDYAAGWHAALGLSQQVGASISLARKP